MVYLLCSKKLVMGFVQNQIRRLDEVDPGLRSQHLARLEDWGYSDGL